MGAGYGGFGAAGHGGGFILLVVLFILLIFIYPSFGGGYGY
ncbi:YjcZ family sporulation protein [Aquibacillus salsiterrae]|uniref:YjcZ family sporulation protein n=1 Tax=Aquibacillus salsiterrae TaxID=2950439 RepID=A0A9X3WHD5_9BACI|nr:YjcZ family sporulation protein [Aquibacillus salsiterrae]MDC3418470.1 YjcZ family sporulation protein [Aquibacillus salsiterrae]